MNPIPIFSELMYINSNDRPQAMTLREYDFVVKHKPGKEIVVADLLSRKPELRTLVLKQETEEDAVDPLLKQIWSYLMHGEVKTSTK